MRLAIEIFLHGAANHGRSRCAPDQNYLIQFARLHVCIGQRKFHRNHGAVNDRPNQRLQRASREFAHKHMAVGQRESQRGRVRYRKLVLDVNQRFAEFLRQFAVRRKIDLVVLQNLLVDKCLQQVINIIAAQVRVAVRRKYLKMSPSPVEISFSTEISNVPPPGRTRQLCRAAFHASHRPEPQPLVRSTGATLPVRQVSRHPSWLAVVHH